MTVLDILAGDGPRVRLTDPIPSHEAADSTENVKRDSQLFVLDLLFLHGPLADHEILTKAEDEYKVAPAQRRYSPSRLRTARHELVESGEVREAGFYRLTPARRRAVVWERA